MKKIILLSTLLFSTFVGFANDTNVEYNNMTFSIFKYLREENPSSNVAYSPFLLNNALNFVHRNSTGQLRKQLDSYNYDTHIPSRTKQFDFDFKLLHNGNIDLDKIDNSLRFSIEYSHFNNPLDVFALDLRSKFFAKWETGFSKCDTVKRKFGCDSSGFSKVDFMVREDKSMKYSCNDSFEFISLPFLECEYDMMIFKPRGGFTLADFNASVYKDAANKLKYAEQHVRLLLPKFKVESVFDFVSCIKKTGLKRLFEYTNDYIFANPNSQISCNAISSITEIEITEEGASAISSLSLNFVSIGTDNDLQPIVFDVNGPFIYVICNKNTSEILYIGQIVKLK